MISIIIVTLCILFSILIFRDIHKAVYLFLPFNYVYDLLFFSLESSETIILNIIRFIVIVLFFIRLDRFSLKLPLKMKPGLVYFVILSMILIISVIFDTLNLKSIIETTKFILILYSFYGFYGYFCRYKLSINLLQKMTFNILAITIINIVIANIFKLGWSGYSEDVGFFTGGIVSNMWYIPSLAITTSMALIIFKKQRLIFIILTIFVLGIIIVAFRRSAYVILGISGVSLLLFYRIGLKSIRFLIIVGIAILLFLPNFTSIFEKQFDARSKTFEKGLNEESRFKESLDLWKERFEQNSMTLLFFGEKPFNSVENYGEGNFGDRPLHVDVNIIFFSSGLVGIILYFLFYTTILNHYFKTRKRLKRSETRHLNYLFVSSFFSLIAVSFSGGLNAITFRIFGFMLLGLSLGQLSFYHKKANENSTKNSVHPIDGAFIK